MTIKKSLNNSKNIRKFIHNIFYYTAIFTIVKNVPKYPFVSTARVDRNNFRRLNIVKLHKTTNNVTAKLSEAKLVPITNNF